MERRSAAREHDGRVRGSVAAHGGKASADIAKPAQVGETGARQAADHAFYIGRSPETAP